MARGTALVTGATGFIGAEVARAARVEGWSVLALVRKSTDRGSRSEFEGERRSGDLNDEATLIDATRDVDVVLHLAGATRAKNEAAFFDANAEGVARLVRAARKSSPGLRRFVYVSSLAALGPTRDGRAVSESDDPRPVSAYGRSKLGGEAALRREAGPLPWTIVRPPIVYGPGERDFYEMFKLAKRRFFPAVGNGEERYSIVHVRDLARGLVALLDAPKTAGGVYHLAEETTYSNRELIRHLGAAVGGAPKLVRLPRALAALAAAAGSALKPFLRRPPLLTLDKLPEITAPGWTCEVGAARRDFDFRTEIAFPEGAASTAAWYRERGLL